jgi:hypothetical protein
MLRKNPGVACLLLAKIVDMVKLPRQRGSSQDGESSSDGSAILRSNSGRDFRFGGKPSVLLTQICLAKAVGFGAHGQSRDDEIAKLPTDLKAVQETRSATSGQLVILVFAAVRGDVRIGPIAGGGDTNNQAATAFSLSGLALTTTTRPGGQRALTSVGP